MSIDPGSQWWLLEYDVGVLAFAVVYCVSSPELSPKGSQCCFSSHILASQCRDFTNFASLVIELSSETHAMQVSEE